MYDFPALHANERTKTGSVVVVDIPGHKFCCLQDIQFASITSCQAEGLWFGGASDLGGGSEVVVADRPLLDYL